MRLLRVYSPLFGPMALDPVSAPVKGVQKGENKFCFVRTPFTGIAYATIEITSRSVSYRMVGP